MAQVDVDDNIAPCPGDTRGDRRCNKDNTHRVCADIGVPGTTFFQNSGQSNWCGVAGDYGGLYGSEPRCPADEPSWCICKWATAEWIIGEGCNDNIQFECAATDVCDLKTSYVDGRTDLQPARDCLATKCKPQWDACP